VFSLCSRNHLSVQAPRSTLRPGFFRSRRSRCRTRSWSTINLPWPRCPFRCSAARPRGACGVLHYGANKAAVVSIGFTVSQPAKFANFSFAMVRGVHQSRCRQSPPTSGPVSTAVSPITVGALLGPCPTAGFAVELYVAATINNSWSRQSEYDVDAEALLGFVPTP
jgi:hypothetical protein